MNSELLKQLMLRSKQAIYIFIVQCLAMQLLMAEPGKSQVLLKDIEIALQLQEVSLEDALLAIEKKTPFTFSYGQRLLKDKTSIQVNFSQANLQHILQQIARQTSYNFRRINNTIYVIPRGKKIPVEVIEEFAQREISGKVTDAETGEPIAGVNVVVSGSSIGTITDVGGEYTMEVPETAESLTFSYVGYEERKVNIAGQSIINIELNVDTKALQEIVVIGYGTQTRENLTGSVSSIEGESLENIPASRVDQVLQGRAAGVQVTQNNGEPGTRSTIRIRGGNSIEGSNDPLFVIDGFIVGTDFNLNNININDIKSIEVLKDATAVAVYGTRGANGVILITTKDGAGTEPGRPRITINSYTGMQYLMNRIDLLDGPQHARYANEDASFRSASIPFPDPENVPNVNWLEEITRDAPISNIDLSVAGQSEEKIVQYYVSGNYFNQQGIVKSSGFERFNFRTNLKFNFSEKIRAGLNINASRLNKDNNKVNFGRTLSLVLPNRAIFNEDGTYTAINPVSTSVQTNPLADIDLQVDLSHTTNLLGNLFIELEPLNNLVIRSNFGPNINNVKRNQYNPSTLPENLIINQGGSARVNSYNSLNLLNENTISYSGYVGDSHQFDLLGGFTWQTYQLEGVSAAGFGFSNDALQFNNLANGSDPVRNEISSNWDSYQLISWLARANYSFKNKYLLTMVGRVDGSSRFAGSNNEYGFFPSAAVAWRISNEPFIEQLNLFSNLKLRASYGLSGSQGIESFRTLAVLERASLTFNGIQQAGVRQGRPNNQTLKWETTAQLDIGLEMGFWENRLTFEIDYYHKKTEDLLLNVQIPQQTGFTSKLQNLGSIKNQGLELAITSINVSNNNFQWTSMLTLAGNRNEVLDLGGVDYIDVASPTQQAGPAGRLIVGETAPVFVGVEYLGTWKSQEEINASGLTGQDIGGPRFKDLNDDNQITVDDFEILGSPQPVFYGGLNNSITWKNWSLDFFIQGSYGNEIFNSLTQTYFFGRAEANKYAETIDRWSPDNPDSDIPRAGAISGIAEIINNSVMVEDGSHIRLKTLKIGYNLPVQRWGLGGITNLNLYFSGSNLLLLSDFRLFDPEVNLYGNDNTRLGFTQGEYPYGRTLTIGLKATL